MSIFLYLYLYKYKEIKILSHPKFSSVKSQRRDAFPTSFLMSQIAENSDVLYSSVMPWEDYPGVINAYNSIVNAPNPTLSLYDYYAFDDKSLAPENNGDGAIDAGETLSIGVALKNRGGVASNILAKIDTLTVDGNVDPFIEPDFGITTQFLVLK